MPSYMFREDDDTAPVSIHAPSLADALSKASEQFGSDLIRIEDEPDYAAGRTVNVMSVEDAPTGERAKTKFEGIFALASRN